jgi:peroxiredoxin
VFADAGVVVRTASLRLFQGEPLRIAFRVLKMQYIRKILILPVLLAVGGLVASSVVDAQPPQSVRQSVVGRGVVQVGDEAPNFILRDLAGNAVSLSQLRGKVVLLNFWATWCGPCRVEMPAMEQLYRTLSRREFEILAVSTDSQGATVTRPFQKQMGFTFPILHDSEYRVGLAYGARTIPVTFMVDRQGVVRQKIFGARDWDSPEARDLIHALLKS